MQRGFATIEIILVTLIIAVLVKVAVPKAAQLIDAVALDYENKRFYSESRYVQAMGRSTKLSITGVGNTNIVSATGTQPTLHIDTTKNYYRVFRNAGTDKPLREPHYLSNGMTIKLESGTDATIQINFDSDGKAIIRNDSNTLNSATLTLTSRLGKKKYIVFNSVGRIRGSLTNSTE